MRNKHLVILALILVFANKTSLSQVESSTWTKSLDLKMPFTITRYTTKSGLPENHVIDIIRKKDRSLYLSTANGIVTFNGYEIEPVTKDSRYRKQLIHKLLYDSIHNRLYALDGSSKILTLDPSYHEWVIPDENLLSGTLDGDKMIVLSRKGNLFEVNTKTGKPKLIQSLGACGLSLEKFYPKELIRFGTEFLISSNDGLYSFHPTTKKLTRLNEEFYVKLKINPFDGNLYGLTTKGLFQLLPEPKKIALLTDGTPGNRCNDFLYFDNGSCYVGTSSGFYFIWPDYIECYTREDGLPSEAFYSLYLDNALSCLFVGTEEKGLLKLQFKSNYSFAAKEGLKGSVNSIIRSSEGKVLIGQMCCNIKELHSDTTVNYGDVSDRFVSLSEIDGVLWAGTESSGIKLIENKKLIGSISTKEQLPELHVQAVYKAGNGDIWVGTSRGIARGKDRYSIHPVYTDLIKERVICFYELRDGTICAGTKKGAVLIKDDKVIRLDHSAGFKGKEVRAFYQDSSNRLWIGSYGGGLFCYENKTLTSINAMKNCMLDADVYTLAKDEYGYLYMSSNHGLWRLSEKDLVDFYKGELKYLVPFHYEEESGIVNTEFNGGFQNNYLRTKMSHFYFPTIEGAVMVLPDELSFTKLKPEFDQILVNDSIYEEKGTTFNRNTYSIEFKFSCTNFASVNNVYFQHRLVGTTAYDWSMPQKSRNVYLRMLPPGKYKFYVRAIDGFNDPKPTEVCYEFEIEPYLYETLAFKGMSAVLLIGIIVILVNWRAKASRRKLSDQENYDRKVAELELKAIQAQLNPHFIFNCLNTIKHFILEKDYQNANFSLNIFSSLIWDSLENSDKMFVRLHDKIHFLTNYIELEKLRNRDQLVYSITNLLPADQNPLLPNMIIQPHVENAIKHGISNLENKVGKLSIEFSQADQNLVCVITDNGIGRVASEKLNRKNKLHISRGTRLTDEKSLFLKQYNNYHCEIEVVDLYSSSDEPEGTKVIITMPLHYERRNS